MNVIDRLRTLCLSGVRYKTTASSSRWLARQSRDPAAKEAKANQLRARSAYKLLEINERHKIFKAGQTVVDLGFAPGAWSQVAISKVGPQGRVLGVDLLPATPPRGVSAMQANFMSRSTHLAIIQYLIDPDRGRQVARELPDPEDPLLQESYIDLEKRITANDTILTPEVEQEIELTRPKVANVVLSDMFDPLPISGFHGMHLTTSSYRMSNTTGLKVADHGASIDLCDCALLFCVDTLKTGGHFVCKVWNGAEANDFKNRMKVLFRTVHVMKPDSSRKESVEIYFIGMHRKGTVSREDLMELW